MNNWHIHVSKDVNNTRLRDASYVIPPKAPESESDSDPEDNIPLAIIIKKNKRETSEDEADIPQMELRKRLNHRG